MDGTLPSSRSKILSNCEHVVRRRRRWPWLPSSVGTSPSPTPSPTAEVVCTNSSNTVYFGVSEDVRVRARVLTEQSSMFCNSAVVSVAGVDDGEEYAATENAIF